MGPTEAALRKAVERACGERPLACEVRAEPLGGGLEASALARLRVRYRSSEGKRREVRFVAKALEGARRRERRVYERVVARYARGFSPRIFAVEQRGARGTILLLEAIPRASAWPWTEVAHSTAVLERAAELHAGAEADPEVLRALSDWDYEAELERSAIETVEALEALRGHEELAFVTRALPAMRRVVLGLGRVRAALREPSPFRPTAIHGDLHPGNVLLRRVDGAAEPVFVDWGRARTGSPFEDVASWLHSLGSFEPEARRRHDTLLRAYLVARGEGDRLGAEVREALSLAGASNALAGALRYQALVAAHGPGRRAKHAAACVAYDWCRVIRRADACLR